MTKEVALFAYSVRDVPAARGDRWTEFAICETTFGIGNGESIGAPPGSSFRAAFEVDDVARRSGCGSWPSASP
jgi:hypothetical protein